VSKEPFLIALALNGEIVGSITPVRRWASRKLMTPLWESFTESYSSSQWQTSQSNIDRTNAIIKRLASMYAGNTGVVPVIAPLNE